MSRALLAAACLSVWPTAAQARLDPEIDKPYRLRIVLLLGENRVFTPLFKQALERGVRDGLQAALADLGRVDVVDRQALAEEAKGSDEPERGKAARRILELLPKLEKDGLQQPLDDLKEISQAKTHFVRIDFADGEYVIRTRQFDGFTGLASPVVREARIPDRQLVARTAGLLVEQDFGVVGTVDPGSKGPEVQVTFKGGTLAPLEPWVQKGAVFAVAQIKRGGAGQRSFRLGETLLQAVEQPNQGRCRCRLLHRYPDPLAGGPAILGYRCLKLGTTEAPLRFRLVDDKGLPQGAKRIKVSGEGGPAADRSTDAGGFSPPEGLGPYRNVAFVQVFAAGEQPLSAPIPVEILDERPVVLRLHPGAANGRADQIGQFEFDRKYLLSRLDRSLLAVGGLVEELERLNQKGGSREEALAKAQQGLRELQRDLAAYRDDQARLGRAPRGLDLKAVDERIVALQKNQDQFKDYIAKLENFIREKNDPVRAELQEMAGRAQLLENEARFDEAIALYEQLLKKGGNAYAASLRTYAEHLDQLKKDWTPKNAEHQAARTFIYKTWPGLETPAQLQGKLETAAAMFHVCRTNGDRLTPVMLLKANTAHLDRLRQRLETILASTKPEDRKEGETIVAVQDGLEKLTNEVSNYLQEKPARAE